MSFFFFFPKQSMILFGILLKSILKIQIQINAFFKTKIILIVNNIYISPMRKPEMTHRNISLMVE